MFSDEAQVVIQVLGPSLFPPQFDKDLNYQYPAMEGIPLFTGVANVTAVDEDPGKGFENNLNLNVFVIWMSILNFICVSGFCGFYI